MKKSIRSFALVAALSLTAAPSLMAEVMGTNPRPQATQVQQFSMLEAMGSAVLAYFGL